MAQFHVINESTEDTFESTDNLQDADRIARGVARQGQVGDPVTILDSGGMAVRQFVLKSDGTVAEQPMAHLVKLSNGEVAFNRAEQSAAADSPRE